MSRFVLALCCVLALIVRVAGEKEVVFTLGSSSGTRASTLEREPLVYVQRLNDTVPLWWSAPHGTAAVTTVTLSA